MPLKYWKCALVQLFCQTRIYIYVIPVFVYILRVWNNKDNAWITHIYTIFVADMVQIIVDTWQYLQCCVCVYFAARYSYRKYRSLLPVFVTISVVAVARIHYGSVTVGLPSARRTGDYPPAVIFIRARHKKTIDTPG